MQSGFGRLVKELDKECGDVALWKKDEGSWLYWAMELIKENRKLLG